MRPHQGEPQDIKARFLQGRAAGMAKKKPETLQNVSGFLPLCGISGFAKERSGQSLAYSCRDLTPSTPFSSTERTPCTEAWAAAMVVM